jgi:hypothetical protein
MKVVLRTDLKEPGSRASKVRVHVTYRRTFVTLSECNTVCNDRAIVQTVRCCSSPRKFGCSAV